MWQYLVAVGVIGLDIAWHRWIDPPKATQAPVPNREFEVPKIEEGSAVPIIYGKVRVDAPVLAWSGYPKTMSNADAVAGGFTVGDAPFLYFLDMFYVVGIGFPNGLTKVHGVWVGDVKLSWLDFVGMTGDGGFELAIVAGSLPGIVPEFGGQVEFLNGNDAQVMCDGGDGTGTPHTAAAQLMQIDGGREVPGYRGYLSALLYAAGPVDPVTGPQFSWCIGGSSTVPAHAFEASSYPNTSLDAQKIGDDANPADVCYDLLRTRFGKLGLDNLIDTYVDYESFRECAEKLRIEGHGYSRVWNDVTPASEILGDVLRQVDGTIYQDMVDGRIKMFLVRPDESPINAPEINPSNCVDLEPVQIGARTGLINRVRVKYTNRNNEYKTDTESADNLANSVGENGEVIEQVVEFLGCTSAATAAQLAARELGVLGRPVLKFRAKVDRSFYRSFPGQLVAVTWPLYNLSGMMFRVARVIPGDPKSNLMTLELISDFYYTQRLNAPANVDGLPHHDPIG
jgi:hypothetical protein